MAIMTKLTLEKMTGTFSIHRLDPDAKIPDQIYESDFYSICKTEDELSIVCNSSNEVDSSTVSSDWQGLKVLGPLDFSLTGILAELSTALAQAGISIFAVSTYDTDYILLKADKMDEACEVLVSKNYSIVG